MYQIDKSSSFADVAQGVFATLDEGRADVAVFTLTHAGGEDVMTVGGTWGSEGYTWLMLQGRHQKIPGRASGQEIFTGQGEEGDAATAATLFAAMAYQLGVVDWRVEV